MDEPYRVVIADDEMISRGYMELFIKPSRRYEVAAALPFASDVIEWCGKNPLPDLIILDVMMSAGVDGLTAAGQIKQKYPSVRIITATSMADTDWLDKARQYGIESFWFKTYSDISLLEVMDRTMAGESVYPEKDPEEAASVREAIISLLCASESGVCAVANKPKATNKTDNHSLFISFHD